MQGSHLWNTDKKSSKQDDDRKRISTFATNSKSDKEVKRDVQTRDSLCVACNEDHLLDSCKVFMEKTLAEGTKVLANKKTTLRLLPTYGQ